MNRIASAFNHGKAFIAFITCGDPDLETTAACVRAAVKGGADLIELGIPFSDPTAEGPVIQSANERALKGGVTTDKIFGLVGELRKDVTVPMVFMTYANVVYSYGIERFCDRCAEVGVDGMILPDVPFEEKEELAPTCRARGLAFISLIAPTSENRVAMIAKEAEGFLYIVADNEGLDSELHLTVNSGQIYIKSGNDGINTNEDGVSVTTINAGSLWIAVEGDEGDGIDSNGWLVINGGHIEAYACATSGDSGIDADTGIQINGGTVIATGNMLDRIEGGGQTFAVFSFAETQKAPYFTLKDMYASTVLEAQTPSAFTNLLFSSPELSEGTYTLWAGDTQFEGVTGTGGGFFGQIQPIASIKFFCFAFCDTEFPTEYNHRCSVFQICL